MVVVATMYLKVSWAKNCKQKSVLVGGGWFLKTYCIIVSVGAKSTLKIGAAVVRPTKANWRKVLYLLIVVGRTSADGREKSQYRENVLGGGNEIQRK